MTAPSRFKRVLLDSRWIFTNSFFASFSYFLFDFFNLFLFFFLIIFICAAGYWNEHVIPYCIDHHVFLSFHVGRIILMTKRWNFEVDDMKCFFLQPSGCMKTIKTRTIYTKFSQCTFIHFIQIVTILIAQKETAHLKEIFISESVKAQNIFNECGRIISK